MATNLFFQNYNRHGNEANLLDDLVIESIRMYGVDTVYLTRSLEAVDEILNEDDLSIFNAAYEMEMYIKSVDGFAGEGDFLSKFGLTIRDQITFTVAYRTFERYATRIDPTKIRPNEGDLIYFPMNQKFFKIMHVEHESVFYQMGALNVFDLKCELFEYGNERFETGREEVDTYYDKIKTESISNLDELNIIDPIAKNIFFEEEADGFIDFSEIDPFSETISNPTNYGVTSDSTNITSDDTSITSDTI
jgi:hypothetical protein